MPPEKLKRLLKKEGVQVLDVHTWRVAPNAVACELVVESSVPRGGDHYRSEVLKRFEFQHLIVKERLSR